MTTPYRIAKPNEFTFKRDSNGVETIEHQGLIFGTLFGKHNTLRAVEPDATSPLRRHIDSAITKAKIAGFWTTGTPAPTMSPVTVTVAVYMG